MLPTNQDCLQNFENTDLDLDSIFLIISWQLVHSLIVYMYMYWLPDNESFNDENVIYVSYLYVLVKA